MDKYKFQEGLLDVCQFLETELKQFLIDEDRFKFRVERFWDIIYSENNSMNESVSKEDISVYGKMLFLLRRPIYSEYNYLRRRGVSKADSAITIIHKILGFSEELGEFKFSKEQKLIKEVVDQLWENIKNTNKNISLKVLVGKMRSILKNELKEVPRCDSLNLRDQEKIKILDKETKFYQGAGSEKSIEL